MRRTTGIYILRNLEGESYRAFVPKPLPPDPPLQITAELYDLVEKANRALGRLDGVTTLLPDAHLFTYFYLRKEAVLSSQIEGTQSSLSELLMLESDEAPGVPLDDTAEVLHYVRAMYHGLGAIKEGERALSLDLLQEIHGHLLKTGRGSENAGKFRTGQNWIGGPSPSQAVFVGPPVDKMIDALNDLERFLQGQPTNTPLLIRAALAHVQFETIHPFNDGNGRLGRLLITLLLCAEKALSEPMLYLSLFFKTHRREYYDRLQSVRETGDWEGWLAFVLTGVLETSEQAAAAAKQILKLFDEDHKRIESLGRVASSALRVHKLFQQKAILSVRVAVEELKLSEPTVGSCMKRLQELGVVREITGRGRNRVFTYNQYLRILDEGTQPIAASSTA